jgi:hypothetical protein
MVRRKPSSNAIVALNPNSFLAFDTSNILLGCPSGLDLSQITFPLNPVSFTISSTSSLIEISKPAPRFTGSLLL